MILTPIPIDLEQGTSEWHRWRDDNGIGSSDVAAILGVSPWQTADGLFAEKLGYAEKRPQTAAMRRGIDLEAECRFLLEWEKGKRYPPACFTTLEYPWMKVSLDGWNKPELIELKAPGKTSHQKHLRKGPPDYYFSQIQYQLAVSGGEVAWFASFNPDFEEGQEFCVWPVARDEAYIDTMLGKVMAFWAALERGILPSEAMWEQSVNGVYAAF